MELLEPQADPPPLLQRRMPGISVSVKCMEAERSTDLVGWLARAASPETTRQAIQNIAGFFSQIAVWDAQQTPERRAA